MDNNVSQNSEPKKRKIWVSILLSLFLGPGLTVVYCGKLRLGIIIEVMLLIIYVLLLTLLGFVMELWYLILIVTAMIISIPIFIWFAIKYTNLANRDKFPRLKRTWLIIIIFITLSGGISKVFDMFLNRFICDSYRIPAASMEKTLLVGDKMMASKKWLMSDIKNGDLIIFRYPGNPDIGRRDQGHAYIKRCIAQGGQKVKIVDKQVYVDDEFIPLPESCEYLDDRIMPYYNNSRSKRDNLPEFTVPKGKLFVLGDNRDNSSDSRVWGFVDESDVLGKPRFIHFSWDSENNRVRWERIGRRLDF